MPFKNPCRNDKSLHIPKQSGLHMPQTLEQIPIFLGFSGTGAQLSGRTPRTRPTLCSRCCPAVQCSVAGVSSRCIVFRLQMLFFLPWTTSSFSGNNEVGRQRPSHPGLSIPLKWMKMSASHE